MYYMATSVWPDGGHQPHYLTMYCLIDVQALQQKTEEGEMRAANARLCAAYQLGEVLARHRLDKGGFPN